MFYCEPCREMKSWPRSLAKSYGKCEICDVRTDCYDRPSSTLPLPKFEAKANEVEGRRYTERGTVAPPEPARGRDRIDGLLALFTEEEKKSWRGKNGRVPTFVTLGIAYFLGEEPANKELMRRLKESGD